MAFQSVPQRKAISRRNALQTIGAALLAGLPDAATAANGVGHVAAVAGTGFAGDAPRRRLRVDEGLWMGDRIWTEALSRATLSLDLGAMVHMGPRTQLTLDRFIAGSRDTLTLGEGAIVFDRDDNLPKIDLEVRSAFAQIGLRGTRFFAGPNRGAFAIFVERGRVRIGAGGGSVFLGAGEGVDIAAPGARASAVTRWPPARIAEAFESVLP